MKNWYQIQSKGSTANVSIHDEIGIFGISAKQFVGDLQRIDAKSINLSINSPGGNVFDGLAMYNALKQHPAHVNGSVLGVAASAASIVLMASDTITMPENAFLMIHNPWAMTVGDSEDLRSMADLLDQVQNSLINIYVQRTGGDSGAIAEMMASETWMDSETALQNGFIESISDRVDIAAKAKGFDRYFAKMPFDIASKGLEEVKTVKDFERCLRDLGASKGQATALVSRAKDVLKQSESAQDDAAEGLQEIESALKQMKIPQSIA